MIEQQTYRLGDERDRLDERLDELADESADGDADAVSEGQQVESELRGVAWACEEYGADAEIVLGGLGAGEYAEVQDRIAQARARQTENIDLPGVSRNMWCAAGLVEAPFLSERAPDINTALHAITERDGGLPTEFVTWVEARVDDLTTVAEGNVRSFAERLAAKRTD